MKTVQQRGFTLIELMMAMAVAGVLMALAAPSFQSAVASARLSSAAGELTAAVQVARSEAIRNNRRVILCRSSDGTTCSNANAPWDGWLVFVDSNADGARNVAEPVLRSGTFGSPVQVLSSAAITALGQQITFRGDGTARASNGQTLLAGTLAICVAAVQPAENVRELSIAFGSRTAVRRVNNGGACNTPADA